MRIGIIGTGNMGSAIGIRLARAGHQVLFGARSRERARMVASRAGAGAQAGSNDDAAAFGEVLIWTARETDPAAIGIDPKNLDGRILVDVNNEFYERADSWFSDQSFAERLIRNTAPAGAVVVKALNTIARESFDCDPSQLRDANAQTFLAGDDAAAKATVTALLADLGFEAIDLGGGPMAYRAAEALGNVILLLMARNGMQAQLALTLLPTPLLDTIGERADSAYAPPAHIGAASLAVESART